MPTYAPVLITGAVTLVNQTMGNQHYVVNTTETVWIYNLVGGNKYTVVPNANSYLTIAYVNKSTDVLDFSLFPMYTKFSDLDIREGSVIVALPQNQIVHILNLHPRDITADSFAFQEVTVEKEKKNHTIATIAVITGVLIALGGLIFVCCIMLNYCSEFKPTSRVDLAKIKRVFIMDYPSTADGKYLAFDDPEDVSRVINSHLSKKQDVAAEESEYVVVLECLFFCLFLFSDWILWSQALRCSIACQVVVLPILIMTKIDKHWNPLVYHSTSPSLMCPMDPISMGLVLRMLINNLKTPTKGVLTTRAAVVAEAAVNQRIIAMEIAYLTLPRQSDLDRKRLLELTRCMRRRRR